MKRSFCILLIASCVCYTQSKAQEYPFFGIGWNQSYAPFKAENFVIGRYNDTRSYLDNPMNSLHFPNGWGFTIGGVVDRLILLEFSRIGRQQTVRAWGTDNTGVLKERDIKLRMSDVSMAVGFSLTAQSDPSKLVFGVSFDLGRLKYWTRVGEKGTLKKKDYLDPEKNFMPASSLFLQYALDVSKKTCIFIRPYLQFPFIDSDLTNLNYEINPNTAGGDSPYSLSSLPINIGVMACYGFRKRK